MILLLWFRFNIITILLVRAQWCCLYIIVVLLLCLKFNIIAVLLVWVRRWRSCGVIVVSEWLQPQRYQNGSKFWDKGGKSGPPLCTPTVPPGIPGCASVYTIHTLAHPLVHICRPSSTHLSTLAHPWIVIFYTPVQPVLTWNLTHSFAHLYSSVTPLSIYLSHAPCIVLCTRSFKTQFSMLCFLALCS